MRATMVVALSIVAATACSRPAELRYESALEQAPEAAAHAVHDTRLAEVMRALEGLRRARLPNGIDPEEVEARQAREVARVAIAMADSARRIPDAAPPWLDADERAEFEALAASLAALCDTLAVEAGTLDAQTQHARLTEIDATCNGCHARYRIPFAP